MKKFMITAGLVSIAALAGCNGGQDEGRGIGGDDKNTSLTNTHTPARMYDEDYRNTDHSSADFGFTRTDKHIIEGQNIAYTTPAIDKEQMADIISKLAVQLPGVSRIASLVTDDEVLVVYTTDSDDREDTADMVKRTALSVVPRYYHVYVSDNPNLAQNVENLSVLNAGSDKVDASIGALIKEMKKSPQGYKVSDGENENGETADDRNMGSGMDQPT